MAQFVMAQLLARIKSPSGIGAWHVALRRNLTEKAGCAAAERPGATFMLKQKQTSTSIKIVATIFRSLHEPHDICVALALFNCLRQGTAEHSRLELGSIGLA